MVVAVLSLSGPRLSADCREVVQSMRDLGISGDVTCNTTLLDGAVERGCRAVVAGDRPLGSVKLLWEAVRAPHGLTCAHVKVESDAVSGCVLDVLRPSACPGKQRPASTSR
jgi:hypothetical protein